MFGCIAATDEGVGTGLSSLGSQMGVSHAEWLAQFKALNHSIALGAVQSAHAQESEWGGLKMTIQSCAWWQRWTQQFDAQQTRFNLRCEHSLRLKFGKIEAAFWNKEHGIDVYRCQHRPQQSQLRSRQRPRKQSTNNMKKNIIHFNKMWVVYFVEIFVSKDSTSSVEICLFLP